MRSALSRTIGLVNDKGGVGKTTITANVAGQLAEAGYRVLAVDLNRQANLSDDLGYRDTSIDDQGAQLFQSVLAGQPVAPVADPRRSNLWLVPGGVELADLSPVILSRFQRQGQVAFRALADSLEPVAGTYDVVLIDSPPENVTLVDLALAAARWIIMPTRSDYGGLVGMRLVSERFNLAKEINPTLGLLGVVLFGTGTGARAIHRSVRAQVEQAFGGVSPMFGAMIRHSERTGFDARGLGRLAHELEVDAATQPAWWESLRKRDQAASHRISETSSLVSGDFRTLAGEILDALAAAEETTEAVTA